MTETKDTPEPIDPWEYLAEWVEANALRPPGGQQAGGPRYPLVPSVAKELRQIIEGGRAILTRERQQHRDALAAQAQEIADLKAERDMWRESYHGTDHAKEQAEWQQERDAMVAKSEAEAAELTQVRSRLTAVEQALTHIANATLCGDTDEGAWLRDCAKAALTPTSPQTPEDR